jgi:hypothetical protein
VLVYVLCRLTSSQFQRDPIQPLKPSFVLVRTQAAGSSLGSLAVRVTIKWRLHSPVRDLNTRLGSLDVAKVLTIKLEESGACFIRSTFVRS